MDLPWLILPVLVLAVLLLPRRYVMIPLLLAVLHTTRLKVISVGITDLSILRTLISVAIVRIVARGEISQNWFAGPGRWMIAWAVLTVLASFAHSPAKENPFIFRCGLTLDYLGFYFIVCCCLRDWDDVLPVVLFLVLALGFLALMLLLEKGLGRNFYVSLGQDTEMLVRNGRIRPRGPFAHAILAGTAGGVLVPLVALVWPERRRLSVAGVLMCCAVVVACSSSGPIMTLATSLGGLAFWLRRRHLRNFLWGSAALLALVQLVKARPIWYLVQYVDFTGGSTGWYRAALLDAGIRHLGEWWLFGTDFTRHWMPTGVSWNEDHADMVNHYLALGVIGGLPAVVCLVAAFFSGFRRVSAFLVARDLSDRVGSWRAWCLGVALFTSCFTFFSVSFFDHTYALFILPLAMTGLLTTTLPDVGADPTAAESVEVIETSTYEPTEIGKLN